MKRGTGIGYRLYLDGVRYAGSRVSDWGVVRAELSESNLWSSNINLSIVDTDYNLWGTYNPYAVLHNQASPVGTHLLNLPLEVHSTIDSGDSYQRQWTGRVKSYSFEDGLFKVSAQDKLKDLSENRFLWDYTRAGTAGEWRGSNIYFTDVPRFWGTLSDVFFPFGGTEGTGGEVIKISNSVITPDSGTSTGRVIREYPIYTVKSGTIINGTGTIQISPELHDYNQTTFLYNRDTLSFSGVPSDIIYEMLCNSGDSLGRANIWTPYQTTEYLCKGTGGILQLNMEGTITDDKKGAVTRAIFDLCKVTMADFYVSVNSTPGSDPPGTFTYDVWSPRKFWEESFATYTEGSYILDGFKFSESVDDVWSGVSISYAYDDALGTYTGNVKRTVDIDYNSLDKIKEFETTWCNNSSEAQVLCDRWAAYYKYSSPEIEIPLTPDAYGIAQRDGLLITHRAGSVTDRMFEVRSYSKNFQSDKVQVTARDMEIFSNQRGYAWWGKADGGGDGDSLLDQVSATSCSGWGYDYGAALTNPCPTIPNSEGTGTVFYVNTSRHGTTFVWW